MMKAILVGDVHGNAPALKQVIAQEGLDPVYFILGDIIGLAPFPQWTLGLVQSLPNAHIIRGNHDHAVFVEGEGHVSNEELSAFEYEWNTTHTSAENQQFVRELSSLKDVAVADHQILMAHARPTFANASGYKVGNRGLMKGEVLEFAPKLAPSYEYVMVGHTHEQWVLDCSTFGHDITFLNPGSLGYENEYLTLDMETGVHSCEQVSYDLDVAQYLDAWALPEECPPASEWW